MLGQSPHIIQNSQKKRRERFQYIVTLYNLTGQEDYTFAEIGIDSLTLVRLLEDIKQLLEEHGAGALVKDVDVRLLQRLTVAEFFSLLDQFEKSQGEPMLALRLVLRRVQEDHESYERECMRADSEASQFLYDTFDVWPMIQSGSASPRSAGRSG